MRILRGMLDQPHGLVNENLILFCVGLAWKNF